MAIFICSHIFLRYGLFLAACLKSLESFQFWCKVFFFGEVLCSSFGFASSESVLLCTEAGCEICGRWIFGRSRKGSFLMCHWPFYGGCKLKICELHIAVFVLGGVKVSALRIECV